MNDRPAILRDKKPWSRGSIAASLITMFVVVSLLALGGLVSRAARPKPQLCPDGRYLIEGTPLLSGVATTAGVAVGIAGGAIVLDGACPPAPVKLKAKRSGTKLKGTWPLCDGVDGSVRLKGKIEPTCQTLAGKLTAKKERVKSEFTAIRSSCGDGTLDPGAGEECDAALGCTPPASCTDACECTDGSITTTTVAGSTSTSATFASSTTTTSSSTTTSVTFASSTTTTSSSTSSSLPSGSTTTTLPTGPVPDPAMTAPPLDPTATTGFAAATSFLFDGPNPVQFNVAAGAIDPSRGAVVRGVVLDEQGAALSEVLLRVLNHPEFGQTLSRSDGQFDMVVNGGGPLTIEYAKDGFLPVQRQVTVPWQDYVTAPEVRLSPLDPQATFVDLVAATEITVARGSEKTDTDGTRQATLLVKPGTAAEMVMPDGSTQPLTQITVRATEYTVGQAGPEMMPGMLPASSGYTYAVELSVDQAMDSGAAMVVFDRPIPTYVENFVGFPTGTPVPAGYYDKLRGQWVAAPNGRVIAVVGIAGGLADLDVTGDGIADVGSALGDLGIDDAERDALAALYAPGQTLWRIPVDHFSAWDCNWPYGPPADAIDPEGAGASASSNDEPVDGSCEVDGSVIECENQVLGEERPLAGTPYTLTYRSDRVPGRLDSLDVRLSGPSLPASLQSIRLRATVAGRTTEQTFSPTPNQSVAVTWNGTDAYGRAVQGGQRVTGAIDYVYPAVYKSPAEFDQSFAVFGDAEISGSRFESTVTASMPFSAVLREGVTDARGLGLGGWMLDVHHFYDPQTQVLHLGSGERRRAASLARIVERVAVPTPPEPNRGFAMGDDGSLYTAHVSGGGRVRRLRPDGVQTIVAGGGTATTLPYGENGPAVGATLIDPNVLAVGPDGLLYILDRNRVILRVDADGVIRRVAGRERSLTLAPCPAASAAEGAVATEVDLCIHAFTVAPDASLYFTERSQLPTYVVRRIGSDGRITTAAGTGVQCPISGSDPCGDGGPAVAARFFSPGPQSITAGSDGSVYLHHASSVRRIGPDGVIRTFAGQPRTFGFGGDGGPAAAAVFCSVGGMVATPDGALLVLDLNNQRIRRVAADGYVSTVAGSGRICDAALPPTGFGGPALQANLGNVFGVTAAPNGDVFALTTGGVVSRVGVSLPTLSTAEFTVASEDGRSLYAFDPSGRHLATLDALTGAVLREFGYDAGGRIATVTEKTGGTDNVTTIERDAAGAPTAIVGPLGRRTTFTVDANGYLASIANPAGEITGLASMANGLLTTFTAPGDRTSTFTYDAEGRLLGDDDAGSGSQELLRTGEPEAFTVVRTTALDRTTVYQVENLPNRIRRRTITAPDGTDAMIVEAFDVGRRDTTAADGSLVTVVAGGDPGFGLEAPVATSVSIHLPSGLEAVTTNTRTATRSDPSDPLSLVTLAETSTVAGSTFATTYTAATRTFITTTPLGRSRTLVLDALGRPTTLQASGGVSSAVTYDARGRVSTITTGSGPQARVFAFGYHAQGLPATFTDPIGRTVTMERDGVGRVVRKTLPGGGVVEFDIAPTGDLVGIVPPGRPAHAFAYGPRGELLSITPPPVAGTGPTTFTYDDDGALVSVTRPDESVTIGYDAAGRTATLDLDVQGGPQGAYALTYDAATGLVSTVSGPGGATLDYTYDGSLVTSVTWGGPVEGSVSIELDERLAVASESVNGGATVAFTHDADDRLVAAGELAITRDATTGLPAATTLGVVSDTWTHDGFGELTDYEATANGTPLFAESFERDGLGRITTRVETIGGSTDTFAYTYDDDGQLTEVTRDGSVIESYTYDPYGNRVGATVAGTSITATYDDQDRLLTYGGVTFAHTSGGRRMTRTAAAGTTAYVHDATGNLLAVTLADGTDVSYVLDPSFRRIARDVDGMPVERFLWSGDRPLAQLDGAGTLVARFVYAGGLAPAYVERDGAAHRLVTDHAGSVRLVVNAATGAVVQRLDYDSFGRVTFDTNPGFQPFGFAGGLYDSATGLVRFGARDYDPITGRWTAKDPIGFAGLDTNLYRYAGNDPVNLADPSGLGAAEIVAAIVTGLADIALFPQHLAVGLAQLGGSLTEVISGIPQTLPPDPNPIVGLLEMANDLAASHGSGQLVDTGSTSFEVTRLCASIVPTLFVGGGGGIAVARGAASATTRGAIRPAMQAAQRTIAASADDAYRPLVSGQAARAERLAAENARRVAQQEARQAAQQASERVKVEVVRTEGGGAGTRGTGKPAGGFGLGS